MQLRQSLTSIKGAKMKMKCMNCGGHMYAEGGFVNEEEASGYPEMPMKNQDHMAMHALENQSHEGDEMLEEVMRPSMAKGYSMGGRVANDVGEGQDADKEPNQFDVLVKDDDLESSYDGANSGDMDGNANLDKEDDEDLDEVMRSRKKKDRLPNPR